MTDGRNPWRKACWQFVDESAVLDVALSVLAAANIMLFFYSTASEFSDSTALERSFTAIEVISAVAFGAVYLVCAWACVDRIPSVPHSPLARTTVTSDSDAIARLRFLTRPMRLMELLFLLSILVHLALWYSETFASVQQRFGGQSAAAELFLITRMARILGLCRFERHLRAFARLGHALLDTYRQFIIALFAILVIMIVIWTPALFMLEHGANEEQFGTVFDALWWAACVLSTTGYGDVSPETTGGKFFSGFGALIGVGFILLPTSILAASLLKDTSQLTVHLHDPIPPRPEPRADAEKNRTEPVHIADVDEDLTVWARVRHWLWLTLFQHASFYAKHTVSWPTRVHQLALTLVTLAMVGLSLFAMVPNPGENATFQRAFTALEGVLALYVAFEYCVRLWCCAEPALCSRHLLQQHTTDASQHDPGHPFVARSQFRLDHLATDRTHTASELRCAFMKRGLSIIDIVCIIALFVDLCLPTPSRSFGSFAIVRLLPLLPLVRLERQAHAFSFLWRIMSFKRKELFTALFVSTFVFLLVSALMFAIEHDAQPDDFDSVAASGWFAVSLLTLGGYGSLEPDTTAGKIVASFFVLLSVGLFALPASVIADGFIKVTYSLTHLDEQHIAAWYARSNTSPAPSAAQSKERVAQPDPPVSPVSPRAPFIRSPHSVRQCMWAALTAVDQNYDLQELPESTFWTRVAWTNDIAAVLLCVLNVVLCLVTTGSTLADNTGLNEFHYSVGMVSLVWFSIEFVLRFWSCAEHSGRLRWLLHPLSIVDLCVLFTLAVNLRSDVKWSQQTAASVSAQLWHVLPFICLLRLERHSHAMWRLGKVIAAEKYELAVTVFIMLVLLLADSLVMFELEHDAQPHLFGTLPDAMWWSVNQLTLLALIDVWPVTTSGRCFAALIAFTGVGLFALPTALLSSGFLKVGDSERADAATRANAQAESTAVVSHAALKPQHAEAGAANGTEPPAPPPTAASQVGSRTISSGLQSPDFSPASASVLSYMFSDDPLQDVAALTGKRGSKSRPGPPLSQPNLLDLLPSSPMLSPSTAATHALLDPETGEAEGDENKEANEAEHDEQAAASTPKRLQLEQAARLDRLRAFVFRALHVRRGKQLFPQADHRLVMLVSRCYFALMFLLVLAMGLFVILNTLLHFRDNTAFRNWFWAVEVLSTVVFTLEFVGRLWSCVEDPNFSSDSGEGGTGTPLLRVRQASRAQSDADGMEKFRLDSEATDKAAAAAPADQTAKVPLAASSQHHSRRWRRGRLRWLLRVSSLFDLAVLMLFYANLVASFAYQRHSVTSGLFGILLLTVVLRLERMSAAFARLRLVILRKRSDLLVGMYLSLFVLIFFALVMFFIERNAQPDSFSSPAVSLWWSSSALTQCTFGDVLPASPAGKVVSVFATYFGYGLFALPSGLLASGFVQLHYEERSKRRRLSSDGRS